MESFQVRSVKMFLNKGEFYSTTDGRKAMITVVGKLLQTLDNHPLKWVHMHVNVAEIMFDASRRFSGSYAAKNDNLEKSLAGILSD